MTNQDTADLPGVDAGQVARMTREHAIGQEPYAQVLGLGRVAAVRACEIVPGMRLLDPWGVRVRVREVVAGPAGYLIIRAACGRGAGWARELRRLPSSLVAVAP